MGLGEIVGGLAVAALCGVGALAFKSDQKWPVFYGMLAYIAKFLGTISLGFSLGISFAVLAAQNNEAAGWAALGAAFALYACLAVAAVANWLRDPHP